MTVILWKREKTSQFRNCVVHVYSRTIFVLTSDVSCYKVFKFPAYTAFKRHWATKRYCEQIQDSPTPLPFSQIDFKSFKWLRKRFLSHESKSFQWPTSSFHEPFSSKKLLQASTQKQSLGSRSILYGLRDIFLLVNAKLHFRGNRFRIENFMKLIVERYFASWVKNSFKCGLMNLKLRFEKYFCVVGSHI